MNDRELDAMLALAGAHALRPQMRLVPNRYIEHTDRMFVIRETAYMSYKLYNWWWASEVFPSWAHYLGFAKEESCQESK